MPSKKRQIESAFWDGAIYRPSTFSDADEIGTANHHFLEMARKSERLKAFMRKAPKNELSAPIASSQAVKSIA